VAVVAVLVFLPGVFGEFVYDDHRFIERNEAIHSLGNTLDFVLDPRTCTEESWEGIYRPLRTFSFAVDYALWGLSPVGFHLQSLFWHVIASLALLALFVRLGLGRGPSTLAVLLFAVHPAQVESVSWVSSRSDVLAGALGICAVAVHVGGSSTRRRRVTVLALAGFAMLAKEAALMLPPLVILLDLAILKPWDRRGPGEAERAERRKKLRSHVLRCWAPLVIAAVLYVGLRQWRTAVYSTDGQFGHLATWWGGSYLGQFAVASRGFFLSVLSACWPVGPGLDFYPAIDAWIDVPVLIAWGLLVLLLAIAFRSYRRQPLVTVGLLWFLIALFPTSNLAFTVGIPSADRFLYVPLMGLLLALAPALGESRRLLAGVTVVVLGVLAVLVSLTYRSDDALWLDASANSPRRLTHVARRDHEEVLRLWDDERRDEALRLIPEAIAASETALDRMRAIFGARGARFMVHTFMQLANLHRLRGDRIEAYRHLKLAGRAHHHHPKTSYLMALLYEGVGDLEGARAEFLLARKRDFKDPLNESIARTLNEQARLAHENGSFGVALHLWEQSRREWREKEGNVGIGARIAIVERERGRVQALPDPGADDLAGWLRRGIAMGQVGLWGEAVSILGGLHRALPRNAEIAVALARWGHEERGKVVVASKLYEMALAVDPGHVDARLGLVRCGAFPNLASLEDNPARRLALLDGLPDTAAVLVLRAQALRDLGRDEDALPLLEEAAGGDGPGVVDAIHYLWREEVQRD
jgi:protein O-mannosyl-transferase